MKLSKKLITSAILFTSTFSFANKETQNEVEKQNEINNLSKLNIHSSKIMDGFNDEKITFLCLNNYSFLIHYKGGLVQIMNNGQAVKCDFIPNKGFIVENNQ